MTGAGGRSRYRPRWIRFPSLQLERRPWPIPSLAYLNLNFVVLSCSKASIYLLDWIEEFLALPSLKAGHFWRIEQTLFALCSSRFGFEHLPAEYTVRLEPGLGGRPFRHYVGAIRHLMYGEGMRYLANRDFLATLAADVSPERHN